MKKKALMVASVASMIYKFNMDNLRMLQELGYDVEVACNFGKENPISEEEISDFKSILQEKQIKYYNIDCPRSIFSLKRILLTYTQLKKIINNNHYNLVHCQSPIGGVVSRLACRKARRKGTKVIYTAHGFHFFNGGPTINWMYYPIEKVCSYLTDIIITINEEDYQRASHFHAKKVYKVPGVGIDSNKIINTVIDKDKKRAEFKLPKDAFVVISVGELSDRKNNEVIIKAISKINNNDIYYLICGQGSKEEYLKQLARELNLDKNIIFIGYRNDINEILYIANCFAFPSKREGLGLAAVEAMTAGLPIVTSNVNGILEYSENTVTGFALSPSDISGFADAFETLYKDPELCYKIGEYNKEAAKRFDIQFANSIMKNIYETI